MAKNEAAAKGTIAQLQYNKWIHAENLDEQLRQELNDVSEAEIEDRFYKHLEFGTGGMRGLIGAGTNRMNVYTVRRATQGLANYIRRHSVTGPHRGVVIAYDSRHFSHEFAKEAALVLANNGIKAFLFHELRPTPECSFAIRELKAAAGIVITASHNPSEYNGYKVYGEDGAQMSLEVADKLTAAILDAADELLVETMDEASAIERGLLIALGDDMDELYLRKLEGLVLRPDLIEQAGSEMKIVYTPLHGTGNKPVRQILQRAGFLQVLVVPEQELPDPMFSTVSSPNPEEQSAFELAIQLATEEQAELILGTDPDTDRVGAVVKGADGEYVVLNGNQTGALLLDYVLSQKAEKGELPANGVVMKTIVTSELGRKIADRYGVETIDTLTGFKFIGEKIAEFERTKEKTFLFGYEESYGYLIGDFVRDKDAVQACLLISEMALYYKMLGMGLYEALEKLQEKYGHYEEDLLSITLKGIEGIEVINKMMNILRTNDLIELAGYHVHMISDYLTGETAHLLYAYKAPTGLPSSNVLRYTLEDGSWFAIRPSGTEPKLKIYFSAVGESTEVCKGKLREFREAIYDLFIRLSE